MLSHDIIEQLKDVFLKLEAEVHLVLNKSSHPKWEELHLMLSELTKTSQKIKLFINDQLTDVPSFYIRNHEGHDRVSFIGIPGGHEFSSLVIAILNSDGKGKLPDAGLVKRIKRLKDGIKLQTYISLSCENCPEVVQNLNLISFLHDDFSHQMIDGEFRLKEIEEMNIQGVPSVVSDRELISSGKTGLVDLLEKLEKKFGVKEESRSDESLGEYDVIVVGAGPAGASAAIYSARKGLKTALIADRMGGQVSDTKGIENLIATPYIEGPELVGQLQKHITEYPINVFEHRKVKHILNTEVKTLELESGEKISTKNLIVASGAKWRELNIPGESEYRGKGVAFCPHCDGPYYKGKKIAVIGGGNSGVEAAIDLAGIVSHITLIEYGAELKADKVLVDKLKSLKNVDVLTSAESKEILGDGKKVNALKILNRQTGEIKDLELSGIFIQIGLVPNSHFLGDLVEKTKFGEIKIDEKGRTSLKGIYAAGDVTNVPYKQIVIAMGEGAKAALSSFEDLMIH